MNRRMLASIVGVTGWCAGLLFSAGCSGVGGFQLVRERAPAAAFFLTPEQSQVIEACVVASGLIEDFNADLRESAGCVLPVLEADDGQTPVIRFVIEERNAENADAFDIAFPDKRTLRITGSSVSLRWALNHILEAHAGIRWLTPSECGAHFPRIENLTVPRVARHVAPSMSLSRRPQHDPYWNKRMGSHFGGPAGIGGVYRVPCSHHLARNVFPVERYMADDNWPDYIFPIVDGERYRPYTDPRRGTRWQDFCYGWQPCLTDERVVEEAVRNITAYFDARPDLHGTSIALNDHGANFCACDTCGPLVGDRRNMAGYLDYSDLYFQWANRVAEGVAKTHPDRFLGTLVYRETLNPPRFSLHDNLVPYITYDIQSCEDPAVRENWESLLEAWHEKARHLGRWEYSWGENTYVMPRVYFGLQQAMMRADHRSGVRAGYGHVSSGAIGDGPKKYLYHKLMWDVDLDLEETLRDWYEACVGVAAAPYLADYFRIWEEIWREEAVKTSWFQGSKDKVYLSRANQSYVYAVRPGDLEILRGLMERVVALAERNGDERQKRRAAWLMADFAYTEAVVFAYGGDLFPASGVVETAEQALAYIKRLPEAVHSDERRPELHLARMAVHLDPGFRDPARPGVYEALAKVAGLASDPAVAVALTAASGDEALPPEVRGLLNVLVRAETGKPVANRMLDGSFEEGNRDFSGGSVTREQAYRGDQSLRIPLSPPHRSVVSLHQRDAAIRGAAHGWYLVSVMVFIETEAHDVESYVRFRAIAREAEGRVRNVYDSAHVNVNPGEWTRISLVANMWRGEIFDLQHVTFHNYGPSDVAYLDDVLIVPLNP